jgi:hypothetical protein
MPHFLVRFPAAVPARQVTADVAGTLEEAATLSLPDVQACERSVCSGA